MSTTKKPGSTTPRTKASSSKDTTQPAEPTKRPKYGGRVKGTQQKVTTQARLEAAQAGLLPHEWLLKVARGEPVPHTKWKITYHAKTGEELKRELVKEEYYADFGVRIDAAKAAAPFYAPRLATQTVTVHGNLGLTKLTDEELKDELLTLIKDMPELLALVPAKGTKNK